MSAIGDAAADSGFTLLEMLVALAIAGLVTGIAFPAVERANDALRSRIAVSAAELAVRTLRAEAVRSGRTSRATPTSDGRGLADQAGRRWALPDGASLALPSDGVAFFADGSASESTMITTTGRQVVRLTIGATGRIRTGR